jgi:hypothetical protein
VHPLAQRVLRRGVAIELPQLYTARYLAQDLLSSGRVVPVRIGAGPPVIPLPYELKETAETLVPSNEVILLGEWRRLSPAYWEQLDCTGAQEIGEELAAISERYGGKPLALLDYSNLMKAQKSTRIVFSAWFEERTGLAVPELLNTGEAVHFSELPKQVQPKRPKTHDRRWSDDRLRDWPLSEADIKEWVGERHWQFARTSPTNPHEYTHRGWGNEQMFLRVIVHIREHGRQEWYGGAVYTVYDCAEWFFWSMGDPLSTTVILNRKYHDPEKQIRLAEERTGRSREELRLHAETLHRSGRVEGRLDRVTQPKLSNIDTKEPA